VTDLLERDVPQADQAYRTAQQVRNDTNRAYVHRLTRSTFSHRTGHLYETRCGDVLSAVRGAILTTHDVTCAGCTPGWKAGPS
jgi:hypothetical protein